MTSYAEQEKTASRIQAYWHRQGHESVRVWVSPEKREIHTDSGLITVVTNEIRSNLKNGRPL